MESNTVNNVINISTYSQQDKALSSPNAKIPRARTSAFNQELDFDWQKAVIAKLNELCSLPLGWDGYRAGPVRFENAHFAMNMLQSICSADSLAPAIVPGYNGDLQIEWNYPNFTVEIHVHAPNKITAWRQNVNTGEEGEEISVTTSFEDLARWVENMRENVSVNITAAA
jgi:hypothetical protein